MDAPQPQMPHSERCGLLPQRRVTVGKGRPLPPTRLAFKTRWDGRLSRPPDRGADHFEYDPSAYRPCPVAADPGGQGPNGPVRAAVFLPFPSAVPLRAAFSLVFFWHYFRNRTLTLISNMFHQHEPVSDMGDLLTPCPFKAARFANKRFRDPARRTVRGRARFPGGPRCPRS